MTKNSLLINQPFTLPCGVTLKNRLSKTAMTERMAINGSAISLHADLYKHWASFNTGLIITGNMMVDKKYRESAGNIVLDSHTNLNSLKKMAEAGTTNGAHCWVQISHGGRQTSRLTCLKPVSASDVQLKKLALFSKPRPLSEEEVEEIIQKYINAGRICKEAGFSGIQIHGAHGYLISQFLSPLTNKRTDKYGGSIENRARLLMDIVKGCRKELGPEFPISVKINSADFQRGGFEESDALAVIKMLEKEKIDLLEISGGTYDNIAFMQKKNVRISTRQREAFFIDFAKKIREVSSIPLMVTGGFRSLEFCEEVLKGQELDMIGLARPYLQDSTFPEKWITGQEDIIGESSFNFPLKSMKDMAEAGFYDYQIRRIAESKKLKPGYSPWMAILRMTWNELRKGKFGLF